ncbi:MAG: hypothetical protein H8E93_03750 [Synechococcus sp.]|nr:hypothetical protein [Synechococcus sp.]
MAPPHYIATVPPASISVTDDSLLSGLLVPVKESPLAIHFKTIKTSMIFG